MRRRVFVGGMLGLAAVGFVRPADLPQRKTVFEEIGDSVRMTLRLPMLVRKRDKEALASIDSGFDTTLRFTLRVWKYGSRELINERTMTVKIRWDPWKKLYLVSTKGSGGWTKRWFEERDEAIDAATTLRRVRIAGLDQVERGEDREDGPYYFVEVLALRNPIERVAGNKRATAAGRSRGRDLEWFGRLVDLLASERALAEAVVHVKTNPFYLVPR